MRKKLTTLLIIIMVLAGIVKLSGVTEAATETWYMRSTTGGTCGQGTRRIMQTTAGATATTQVLGAHSWNKTESRSLEAGDWQVFFDITVGTGGGASPVIEIKIERYNSSCVLQQTILSGVDGTINLNAYKGMTVELSTTPKNPGAITFASGDIVVVSFTSVGGNQTKTLRFNNAAGTNADTRLLHPGPAGAQPAPSVTTSAATNVAETTATLNGSANPNGAATTGWFRYSSTNPGSCNDTFGTRAPGTGGTSLGGGSSSVAYSENISGLTANTTYHFCAIAENSGGKSFGSILSFTTTSGGGGSKIVRIRIAASNSSTGPWADTDFLGPDCTSATWYVWDTDGPGVPKNVCASQNNRRYFRYKFQLEGDATNPVIQKFRLNYAS